MTTLTNWFSPNAMQSLGWTLWHFLWQGSALAALAAAAMALCRRASARYLLGVSVLVLMLLTPVATFFFYSQQHFNATEVARSSPLAAAAWKTAKSKSDPNRSAQTSSVTPSLDMLPWLVEAWLLGVAFFSLRSAGGFLLLERERRRQSTAASDRVLEICYTLQDRFGLKRAIAYCECKCLQTPAVVGWFRPIVFLPVTALTGLSEEQLEAVIDQ